MPGKRPGSVRAVLFIVALTPIIAAVTPAPAANANVPQRTGERRCDWPMWGRDRARTFATACTTIDPSNVGELQRTWFFNTHDVVTATPAVVDDTVYVGDWSGRFYALRRSDGTKRWVTKTKPHPRMYAGQIVSSAAVARIGGVRTVFFGGGKSVYALNAADGSVRWQRELGRTGDGADPTEVESSPVVVGTTVLVGWDVHNSPAGEPAGVLALDARTGKVKWRTITAPTDGPGATGAGCGDVWSSPTVDVERRLVFVGTGNCVTSPRGWGRFSEAVIAMNLDDGAVEWTYQPHQPNRDDLDFAGAPNLFVSEGRGAGRAGRQGRDLLRARPRHRRAGVVDPGRRTGAHRTGQQLLHRRVHRPDARSPTASSRAAPRSAVRRTCTPSTPTPARWSGSSPSLRPPMARRPSRHAPALRAPA